jgi:hypothetical protein
MLQQKAIHNNITASEYDAIDAINYSSLKKFMISPMHHKANLDAEPYTNEAFNVGNAVHHFCLKPESFESTWTVAPVCDKRTKDGKEAYAQFLESSAGKSVLAPDEWETVKYTGQAVKNNKFFKELMGSKEVHKECVILADYAGVVIKGRLDAFNVTENCILDIKTFNKPPEIHSVISEIFARKYHYQAYIYRKLGESITGGIPDFYWCFVEKNKPNSVAWFKFSPNLVTEDAIQGIEEALCRFQNAKNSDIWTGFANENEPYVL